jgi:hypothetical protein
MISSLSGERSFDESAGAPDASENGSAAEITKRKPPTPKIDRMIVSYRP